jgi:hypothetical protein
MPTRIDVVLATACLVPTPRSNAIASTFQRGSCHKTRSEERASERGFVAGIAFQMDVCCDFDDKQCSARRIVVAIMLHLFLKMGYRLHFDRLAPTSYDAFIATIRTLLVGLSPAPANDCRDVSPEMKNRVTNSCRLVISSQLLRVSSPSISGKFHILTARDEYKT